MRPGLECRSAPLHELVSDGSIRVPSTCNAMETYQRAEDGDYMRLTLHVSKFRL